MRAHFHQEIVDHFRKMILFCQSIEKKLVLYFFQANRQSTEMDVHIYDARNSYAISVNNYQYTWRINVSGQISMLLYCISLKTK